jgi:hypothetical protein
MIYVRYNKESFYHTQLQDVRLNLASDNELRVRSKGNWLQLHCRESSGEAK